MAAGSNNGDDPIVSKRALLAQGFDRVRRSGAYVAGHALDRFVDRFTPRVQRPPGAIGEMEFLLACTRCGECSRACPVNAILVLGERAGVSAGTPYLDVNEHRPCTACHDTPCIPVCPTGALLPIDIRHAVLGTAVIDRDTCLGWNEQTCTRCADACPVSAEAVLVVPDGRVFIDPRACIGCGLCRAACPTRPKSVEIEPPPRY